MRPNTGSKQIIAKALSAIMILMAVYMASFFLVRQTVILDYLAIDSHGNGTCITAHYFSQDQRFNRASYYLYYPLHSLMGGDARAIMQAAESSDQWQENTIVYVKDLKILKRQGAVGFEDE